jgi:hypothetical protein
MNDLSPTLPPIACEAPDALWAIGSAPTADGHAEYPLFNRDVDADARWAGTRLAEMGVDSGSMIDLVHNYRETGQFWPYYIAAARLGAAVMNGMATPWDVGRLEMYARRFDLALIMGPGTATIEGLRQFGHDPVEVLSRASTTCVRSDALALLDGGTKFWRMTTAGPMLLIAGPGSVRVAYDDTQWTVETGNTGTLMVTTRGDRAARYDRLDTGVRGSVEGNEVVLASA